MIARILMSLLHRFIFIQNFSLENQIKIREPSPSPIIDRSKHYTTRFSTHKSQIKKNIIQFLLSNNLDSPRITLDIDDDGNESKFH